VITIFPHIDAAKLPQSHKRLTAVHQMGEAMVALVYDCLVGLLNFGRVHPFQERAIESQPGRKAASPAAVR
jgi:hypothetical protein